MINLIFSFPLQSPCWTFAARSFLSPMPTWHPRVKPATLSSRSSILANHCETCRCRVLDIWRSSLSNTTLLPTLTRISRHSGLILTSVAEGWMELSKVGQNGHEAMPGAVDNLETRLRAIVARLRYVCGPSLEVSHAGTVRQLSSNLTTSTPNHERIVRAISMC